jgi:uncharacterized protein YcaQ
MRNKVDHGYLLAPIRHGAKVAKVDTKQSRNFGSVTRTTRCTSKMDHGRECRNHVTNSLGNIRDWFPSHVRIVVEK